MQNKRAVFFLLLANAVSGLAQGVSMIAIPWYFANVLGKSGVYGFAYGFITLATLFWGLYAGTLIDKFSRKHVYLATSLTGGCLLLISALSGYSLGKVPEFLVILVLGITFFIFNIHYPNLYAFAQEIMKPKHYARITSYIEVQGQSTNAVAGGVAAILLTGTQNGMANLFGFQVELPFSITPWTLSDVFMLNAVTYFLSFGIIAFLRYVPMVERSQETGSALVRLKRGLQYLRDHPLIFIFGTASYAIFVVMLTSTFFLFPIYINNHLQQSADVYGTYELYVAIGSVLAGVGVRWVFGRTNSVMAVTVMTFLTALIFYLCVFNTWLWLFYLIAFLFGFSNAGTRVTRITYLFHHIPNNVIGRANSVFQVINVMFRTCFIFLFALPFFNTGNQIVYAYFIFATFLMVAGFVLVYYYRRLVNGA